jgi:hypothetical protein
LWRRDHTDRPVPAGMIHHSHAGRAVGPDQSDRATQPKAGAAPRWNRCSPTDTRGEIILSSLAAT